MPDNETSNWKDQAEQGVATAGERAWTAAAAREEQGIYLALINAIGSGFCIIEMIFDEDGRAIDYRFIEANPAFERQSGLVDAVGRRIREFAPDLEEHWFERYGRVALTGEPMRIEGEAAPLGRWFDINAFRVGEPEQRRVAVLFTDITARRKAEESLRASEARGRNVLENMSEAFVLLDRDFRIVDLNAEAMRLEDRPREAIIGKTHWDAHPGAAPELGDLYRLAMAERREVTLEHRYVWPDGRATWIAMRAFPVGDGLAIFYRDVTGRKVASEALCESEERQAFLLKLSDALRAEPSAEAVANRALHMLFEQMGLDRCYIGIYRLEEDRGEFPHQVYDESLLPLPAHVRLSDFPKALEIASDRTLVINDVAQMEGLSDDDRANFEGLGHRAIVTAAVRKGKNNPLWAIVAGSMHPRAWTQSEVSLVEEVAERTWAAVERARAEAASKRAEARVQQLVALAEVSSEFFGTCDMEFMPTFGNAAAMRLVGLADLDQVKQTPLQEFFFPEDLAFMTDEFFPRVLREGQGKTEIRFRHFVTGEPVWVVYNLVVLKDEMGQAIGLGTVTHDITERKRTEAILRDSERHQGLLLAELQHRVRNILTMVRSVARRTAENCEDVDDYVRHLDGRLSSLARVQTILTRRAGRGANLYDLVLDELQMQTAPPGQYRIEGPEVELSPKAAEVLSLAVHELATNSIKYGVLSEPIGTIRIGWSIDDRDGQAWLRFTWNEPIGPRPDRPSRTGFGTDLIKNRVPYELRGTGDIRIGSDEVEAQIDFPLANEQSKHKSVAAEKVMGQ